MNTFAATCVAAAAVVCGVFFIAIDHAREQERDFKAICRLSGGVEVHNGRHWVCLYPHSQGFGAAPTGSDT